MVPSASIPVRILCVDDNHDAAESLALILQLVGLEAEAAFDGPSALQAAARFRPHACVSDINMPGMDGYQLARRLRQWAGSRPLLLIAVTARTTDEDRRRSLEAGFDLHLNKPADPGELLEAVAAFGNRLTALERMLKDRGASLATRPSRN